MLGDMQISLVAPFTLSRTRLQAVEPLFGIAQNTEVPTEDTMISGSIFLVLLQSNDFVKLMGRKQSLAMRCLRSSMIFSSLVHLLQIEKQLSVGLSSRKQFWAAIH
eukprot:TRINITY_DN3989_c0_g1_i4.p3 TRINITY_DN3989_c0_g1~~TRINITY_DN3989_c0_g1_i4.p3  ORF type:complete len:106 (-),score=5.72 TRINITY_DN3989_c0_g1_i4:242-559(-)